MESDEAHVSEFLRRFRINSAYFICNAYLMSSQSSIRRSFIDGSISTTLAEDVFTIVDAQIAVLNDFLEATNLALTDTGNAIVTDALLSIFRMIFFKQLHYGRTSLFLNDMDSCIARANDFCIMGEKSKIFIEKLSGNDSHLAWKFGTSENNLPEWDIATNLVQEEASKLIDRMNLDSVQASYSVAINIIQAIQQLDIPRELFSRHWEEDLTNNEVATYIVRVYSSYLFDLRSLFVSDYLYQKVLITLARCTICFYLKSFIVKAARTKSSNAWYGNGKKRKDFFRRPRRALMRMTHDIDVFENYFLELSEGMLAIKKIISNEFSMFRSLLLECSSYAVGENSHQNLDNFIIVIHKRTGADSNITRHFLTDVFSLMGNGRLDHCVANSIRNVRDDLDKIKENFQEEKIKNFPTEVTNEGSSFYQVDEMLKEFYAERIFQESIRFCSKIRKRQ